MLPSTFTSPEIEVLTRDIVHGVCNALATEFAIKGQHIMRYVSNRAIAATAVVLAVVTMSMASAAPQKPQGMKPPGASLDFMQDKDVKRVLTGLEQASQKAIDAEPDLKARMSAALKAATSIQNPQQRRKAMEEYRSRFGNDYRRALRNGGVDVMDYANQIAKIVGPRYNVTPVLDDLGGAFAIVARVSSLDLSRALTPAPSDRIIPYSDYTRFATNSCAGFTGSSVSDRDDGFHVSTSGGFAAGCGTRASREATAATVSRATTTVEQRANVNINGTVAGIVGLGVCSLWVDLVLHGGDTPGQRTYQSTTVVAPILWVASYSFSQTWTHSMTSTRTGFLTANYWLSVGAAAGILGGADCHGDVGAIQTRVTVGPR